MLWKRWMLLLALISVTGLGCGGDAEESTPPADEPATEAVAAKAPQLEAPAQAVAEFLDANRVGNDAKAAAMFTLAAREQIAALEIEVAPRRSDTARFNIGKVEYVDGGARVAATWTDLDADGEPRTDDMLWMLRVGPEGWRIAGMAAKVFDGEPPILLDFENLEEAIQKLQMVRQIVQQRNEQQQQQAPLQATQPSVGGVQR